MLANFTDILEYSLSKPNELVSLADEIKNTHSYIEIQQIRYKNMFEVIWEYDQADIKLKVIKLILQPLVENSIYHGIKEKKGRSSIKIRIKRLNGFLKISIIDNGIGISKDCLKMLKVRLTNDGNTPTISVFLIPTNGCGFIMGKNTV